MKEVWAAVAGIDSHKDTLAVAVVDNQGRELDRSKIENSARGHNRLIEWAVVRRYMSAESLQKARLDVIKGEPEAEEVKELVEAS